MAYIVEFFCVSHKGHLRSSNQDNFCYQKQYLECDNTGSDGVVVGRALSKDQPVFAVFDGMGGEECGEMAAYIAAKGLAEYEFKDPTPTELEKYCLTANDEICRFTEENSLTSMGTTAAILRFMPKEIQLCNIGDSKIYRYTNRMLRQISYDHVSIGVFGAKPPLTQNLGIREDELIISPYISSCEYHANDIYLICSDGLTDMVSNEDIWKILSSTEKEECAELLLRKALENGGKDNITLILLCVNEEKKSFLKKIINGMRCRHDNK